MEAGSSSSSAALAAAPQTAQTASKLVGRPYRKRAKNAVLNDPTLEQVMGSKEKALDVSTSRPLVQLELIPVFVQVEEFSLDSPLNLDNEDKGHWIRLRKALFDEEKVTKAAKHTNPRSFGSELAHARQTLRMLQDVAAGTREKFEISGSQPKRAPKTTTPKTIGIAKAKRTKSTKARDNHPSQPATNPAVPSSSAADEDDEDTDAMDYTLTNAVFSPAQNEVFETAEERAANDEAMRQEAVRIREEFPALNDIPPETMKAVGHLVDLGLW